MVSTIKNDVTNEVIFALQYNIQKFNLTLHFEKDYSFENEAFFKNLIPLKSCIKDIFWSESRRIGSRLKY